MCSLLLSSYNNKQVLCSQKNCKIYGSCSVVISVSKHKGSILGRIFNASPSAFYVEKLVICMGNGTVSLSSKTVGKYTQVRK